MLDPDIAMRAAVSSTLDELGYPNEESDVDEFLAMLRSYGYVVERLNRRSGETP